MVARWLRQIDRIFGARLRVAPNHQLQAFDSPRALAMDKCFTHACFWPLAIACLWTQILAIIDGRDEHHQICNSWVETMT